MEDTKEDQYIKNLRKYILKSIRGKKGKESEEEALYSDIFGKGEMLFKEEEASSEKMIDIKEDIRLNAHITMDFIVKDGYYLITLNLKV